MCLENLVGINELQKRVIENFVNNRDVLKRQVDEVSILNSSENSVCVYVRFKYLDLFDKGASYTFNVTKRGKLYQISKNYKRMYKQTIYDIKPLG